MGHIAHLRKQFKSINTYDYIITMIKRRNKNIIILMRIKWFFFEQRALNPIHPRILCAKFGWDWLSGSREEDFLNFVNVFSLFRNYLPLEKDGALHLNELANLNPFTQGCFVPSLVEIGPVVLEKKDFLISSMYFQYFIIFSQWKRAWPFI